MDIRNIEYFLQLAKFEHVSATADFLNISQPSLSKHIHILEKELGIKLFDRIGNRIALNKNGEEFAQYAERALELLKAGINSAKSSIYDTKGQIHIASSTYSPLLAQCIAEYSALNPHVAFQVTMFQDSTNANDTEQTDFLLNFTAHSPLPLDHNDRKELFWVPQPLFQENYVLIFGPQTAERICTDPFDLAELKNERFIAMNQSNVFFSDITVNLCLNAGFFPRIYAKTDEFLIKVKLVQQDLAIAFIPECCLADAIALAPKLSYIPLNNSAAKRTINLMRRKKVLMTEAALDFWNFVLDYYSLPEDNRE